MKRIASALALSGLLMMAGSAQATPLGTITADGLVFSLSVDPYAIDLDGDGSGDNFLYTLTLNTSGYDFSDADWITWVSPNVAKHDGASQVSSPAGWVFHDGAANNSNGCNDTLAAGKICSQASNASTVLDGTLYTWTFNIDTTGDDPFINPPHLQAAWFGLDDKGKVKKINAISVDFETGTGGTETGATETGATETGETETGATETGSEVPEPASMLLLGSGLAGAALKLRRNRK